MADELNISKITAGSFGLTAQLEKELEQPNCPLGSSVYTLFLQARDHRVNSGVDLRMRRAFYSGQMKYLPEHCAALGSIDIFLGIFARLRAIFLAWHFDRVVPAGEKQFTISPTPVPEVPDSLRQQAISFVVDNLIKSGVPPEQANEFLRQNVATMKANVFNYIYKKAKAATDKMSSSMLDTMVEGNYLSEYFSWWMDFATFPVAIMQFPCVEVKKRLKWSGTKVKVVEDAVMTFKSISPLDFWTTSDGSTPNNCRAVFVKDRITYEALFELSERATTESPIKRNIQSILDKGNEGVGDWMTFHTTDNEVKMAQGRSFFVSEHAQGTFDTLKCYQKISGKKLKEYGITSVSNPTTKPVEDRKLYEVQMWMIDRKIVYIVPNAHPLDDRGFYTASWEPIKGTIYGKSLYDTVQNAERAACKTARDMVKSNEFSAGIIAEVDGSRFADGSVPQTLQPWKLYRTEVPMIGGSPNAIQLQTIPSKAAELMAVHDHYIMIAEKDTGIQDFMSGALEGTSGVRTNGVAATVQQNSTRLINYRAMSADKGCFLPMFKALWTYHMLYNPDDSIKSDASVDLKGLTSVATRDAQTQGLVETLQFLPAIMQAMQQTGQGLDPRFINQLVKDIFRAKGADTTNLSDPEEQTAIQDAVGSNQNVETAPPLDGRSIPPATVDVQNRLPAA